MQQLSDVQLAWVAGVLDARAHIEVNSRGGTPQPRVRVTTRKLELLQRLSELTGTKVVLDDRGYTRRPCGEHCEAPHSHVVRQSAQWTIDSSRATVVLANVLPYMVAQHGEAALALEAGRNAFPPLRGDVPRQLRELGWTIPEGASHGLSVAEKVHRHPGEHDQQRESA